jgi:RNA polymerase sigma factor (sigma-70 family)
MVEDLEKTDEELLRLYQLDKNPHFLNLIFSRYLDVGFRTAMGYMRNVSDAEDVLQLAFIQFLNNLQHFREGSTSVKPWLMKMIVNTSLNKLKEEKRRAKRQQNIASERFMEYSQKENQTDESNDAEILKQKIKKLVDGLPEKYRSPISLVLYEGFSYPEVATVLELPEKTVRNYVYRGIEKLKSILGSYGSVLSVEAISSLMINSTLEVAPATTKKIIESPELYKNINSIANSNRLLITKASTSISKMFLIFAVSCIAIGFCYFLISHKSSLQPNKKITGFPTELVAEDTNRVWSFENEKDRDLSLLLGRWEWSSKNKSMVSPVNAPLILSLPILSQKKAFLIEMVVHRIAPTKINPISSHLLTAFWAKEGELLEHDRFELPKSAETITINPTDQRIYIYQNYICVFVKEKCTRINKCTDPLTDAKVAILSKDISFNRISTRTLDSPPDELQKAIDSIPNLKGEKQSKWLIDEKMITVEDGDATNHVKSK